MHTYCICCGHDACDYSRSVSTYPQNCPSHHKNVLLTDPLHAGFANHACNKWGFGIQANGRVMRFNLGQRKAGIKCAYLLFLSCIGKLANRPMTSSMLRNKPAAVSVKTITKTGKEPSESICTKTRQEHSTHQLNSHCHSRKKLLA